MKHFITLLLVLQFNFYFLYSQTGNSESSVKQSINTKEMVQGDYRFSQVYLLPEYIDTSVKALKLETFIDSVPSNFVSENEIWIQKNCPDCGYTGPVIDKDKSKRILIYLMNLTDTSINIRTQDATLQVIQEAKDSSGNWKPIEYWVNSSCFNSYSTRVIPPKHYISIAGYRYTGSFLTEIRFKMRVLDYTVVSDPFHSFINYSQFEKPKDLHFKAFF